MVDINDKKSTARVAIASGQIKMKLETLNKIIDMKIKKGDVLVIEKLAGIMAAKKTSDLIPLCHNINLSSVNVIYKINLSKKFVSCEASVSTIGKTGVEMEALTAVQIGLLTIYDMCKAIDRGMIITDIQLESKKGGASGEWKRSKQ
jgi:cyclic pyranopterin phosphate synthase